MQRYHPCNIQFLAAEHRTTPHSLILCKRHQNKIFVWTLPYVEKQDQNKLYQKCCHQKYSKLYRR